MTDSKTNRVLMWAIWNLALTIILVQAFYHDIEIFQRLALWLFSVAGVLMFISAAGKNEYERSVSVKVDIVIDFCFACVLASQGHYIVATIYLVGALSLLRSTK